MASLPLPRPADDGRKSRPAHEGKANDRGRDVAFASTNQPSPIPPLSPRTVVNLSGAFVWCEDTQGTTRDNP